jgi:hypothetical protein
LIFLDLTRPSNPRHSRGFLDVHPSAGGFLEKVHPVTGKEPFHVLLRRRLRAINIKMPLDGPGRSSRLNRFFLDRINRRPLQLTFESVVLTWSAFRLSRCSSTEGDQQGRITIGLIQISISSSTIAD